MDEPSLLKTVVFELNRVAVALNKHPLQLRKVEFLDHCHRVTEWDLRKVGGFAGLLNRYFRYDAYDLKAIQSHRNHLAYVRQLEQTVGNRASFQESFTTALVKHLQGAHYSPRQLNKAETTRLLKAALLPHDKGETRSIVTLWSDHHFGTNVSAEEMGGKNRYDWTVGARRLGKLVEQVATYKQEKRSVHEELVILLAGDNIGGVIHHQEGPDLDLLVFQICGTTAYYRQAIDWLKNFYPKIRVVCQPGNHGRVAHKQSQDRAFQQKYDSFENVIFYALSGIFAADPKVSFEVSKAPFSDVRIQGHRVYVTHGDTVFNLGNVSNNVRVATLELQVNRINAEELRLGKSAYELFCLGHVHHAMVTELASGARLAINSSLIGTDPYALGIGIHSSSPAQLVWESTKKFVQGDVRIINVSDADEEVRYERIIRPYRYELKAAPSRTTKSFEPFNWRPL